MISSACESDSFTTVPLSAEILMNQHPQHYHSYSTRAIITAVTTDTLGGECGKDQAASCQEQNQYRGPSLPR